jgi:DNA-binding MarR family transcriptional regulator
VEWEGETHGQEDGPAPPTQDPLGFDAAPEAVMMHLIAVIDAARSAVLEQRLRANGLSIAKHRALGWIGLSPGCTMSELSRGTFIDRTTLTRSIDQLVSEGHVRREAEPKDRRKVVIWRTPSGERLLSLGEEIIAEVNETIAGALELAEVRVINKALLGLIDRLVLDEDARDRLTARAESAETRDFAGS